VNSRHVALMRAIEVAGGVERLSVRLGVSRLTVLAMMSGRIDIPQRMFFQLVDVISMQSAPDPSRRREHPGPKRP